ncbi:MAG: HoxN/HupN/NixA family nickel/cobalt transporter [Janthinobacterium lividum]
MPNILRRVTEDGPSGVRARVVAIYVVLAVANVGAWLWAFVAFRHFPLLLGTALLAYSFGLRHAVDADHIAAIDNVTRKLMQDGRRPVAVGFFFSLGHSTVVVLASVAIAVTATRFGTQLDSFRTVGGVLGALVSSAFLFAIAAMNIAVLRTVWATFQRVKAGGHGVEEDTGVLPAGGGILSRLFRPLFATMGRSWHMYPLGLLFGLGFDTATEVGLLGISATQASSGLSVWSILVFPALFTAGMSLIDTTDGILMLGTYGWAFLRPIRKIYYNLTITAVSIVVALLVGGIEALGLIGGQLALTGGFWDGVGTLNEHFESIGFVVIGIFVASWILSAVIYRLKGYDRIGLDA